MMESGSSERMLDKEKGKKSGQTVHSTRDGGKLINYMVEVELFMPTETSLIAIFLTKKLKDLVFIAV